MKPILAYCRMNSQAEAWMTEIQDKFNDATNRKLKYVEQITLKEKRTRETQSVENTLTKHEQGETQHARDMSYAPVLTGSQRDW